MDIRTIVHHIRNGVSERQTAHDLGVNRRTVRRYHTWAREHGLLTGDLPPLDELQRLSAETLSVPALPQNASSVEPYRTLVEQMIQEGVEIAAIRQRLIERGYSGSYASVYRFVHKLSPRTPEACVRVERAPGEEAQVDFGYAGLMIEPSTGALRRCWAFVMTLSYSRHQYVEFVFDQKVSNWLLCHNTTEVIRTWLSDPVIERLFTCGRLLKLRDRYADNRLEAACARALSFADPTYITIKRILQKGIEDTPTPVPAPSPPASAFVRSAHELLGHLKGGDAWN